MTTTVLAVRSSSLYRHTAAWACAAALAVTAVAAAAPAQAAAHATGHGRAAPARAAAATPPGREWAAFAFYLAKNELVLFGGRRPGTACQAAFLATPPRSVSPTPSTASAGPGRQAEPGASSR